MSIADWVASHARNTPAKTALIFDGVGMTYGDLDSAVARTAGFLLDRGVARGDRVAVCALNHPEIVILLLASARIGAIFLPLNWRLSPPEIGYIVADAGPKLIFADAAHAPIFDDIACKAEVLPLAGLPELRASVQAAPITGADDDEALLVYTSGTTGRPKGAVLSQAAIRANAAMSRHMYDLTTEDRSLVFLPLFHVGGINILLLPTLAHGGTVVLMAGFASEAALTAIREHAITQIVVVPTVLGALMKQDDWGAAVLASLRSMSIGSTDVPRAMIEAVHALGLPMPQVYGATETGPMAIYQRAGDAMASAGSLGRAGSDCEIRLCDAEGREVAMGETGEICLRGGAIFSRYWNDTDATRAAFRYGWFRTGDAAYVDKDGYYWFADRIKHVIISGGENIYPAELARVLEGTPGLAEYTVVGRADPKWGQVPVVLAVRKEGVPLDAKDILARFEGRIARFKHPRDVVFVDALPRNAMGKVIVSEAEKLVA